MKCIKLEVYMHIADDENPDEWDMCEAIGSEVVAWTVEENDCPIIIEGTCPSCGRYTEPTPYPLERDESPACGDCSRVAT